MCYSVWSGVCELGMNLNDHLKDVPLSGTFLDQKH